MFALNSTTVSAISRELDVCALRHELYSANIANVDVPGYERLDVAKSTDVGMRIALTDAGGTLDRNPPAQVISTHDSVTLDQEMAKLSKNALRYETLLTAYQQTSGILSLAIKDGRGA